VVVVEEAVAAKVEVVVAGVMEEEKEVDGRTEGRKEG
jgi:hypothetical protein